MIRRRVSDLLLLVVALAVLLQIRLHTPLGPTDDAYMTWRGAMNLALGNGFVYNLNERVLPTSTPLYAALLGACMRIFGATPDASFFPVALLLDSATLFLFWQLCCRSFERRLLVAPLVLGFALNYAWALASIQGMETPLLLFLMLLSARLLLAERPLSAAAAAGLVALCRPEGAMLTALVLLTLWKRVPEKRGSCLALGSLPLILWLAFSTAYYGSPIPQSMLAKSRAYVRPPGSALYWSLLFSVGSFLWSSISLTIPLLAAFLVCLAAGARVLRSLNAPCQVLASFSFAVLAFYTVTNPLLFFWYSVAMMPGFLVLAHVGLDRIVSPLGKLGLPLRLLPLTIAVQYALCPCLTGDRRCLTIASTDEPITPCAVSCELIALGTAGREELYRRIGERLASSGENVVVLAPEFGALGYGNVLKIISSLGHVNPEVLPYLPVPPRYLPPGVTNAVSREMVEAFMPTHVVSMRTFIEVLEADPWFRERYELEEQLDGSFFGPQPILVYKRKPSASSASSAVAFFLID